MAKYEILIANKDTAESHRKNKGDIIAVRPHPWNWGLKEIKFGLIVIVESSRTDEQMRDLASPTYEHNSTLVAIPGEIYEALDDAAKNDYRLKKKGSRNISIASITSVMADIDNDKIEDDDAIYQPFKSDDQLVSRFDGGRNSDGTNRHSVALGEVDTNSSAAPAGTELSIRLNTTPNFIQNESTGLAEVFT